MPGKAYQSSLIPYKDEIFDLRRRKPPVTYAQIAQILHQKYNLRVCRETVFKFVRVRSRRRKIPRYEPGDAELRRAPFTPISSPASVGSRPLPDDEFEFTYSERYNLTRLPPEEAAARRKKLEKEGH